MSSSLKFAYEPANNVLNLFLLLDTTSSVNYYFKVKKMQTCSCKKISNGSLTATNVTDKDTGNIRCSEKCRCLYNRFSKYKMI